MISNILKYHASSGPKKWILWIVISVAVLAAVIALYLKLNKRQQDIKRLRIEADLAEQHAKNIRFDILREQDSTKLIGLADKARAFQVVADTKRAEITQNEKEFEAEYKQVKALESWKDLDAYNKKSRS